jgi:hypothetical protein
MWRAIAAVVVVTCLGAPGARAQAEKGAGSAFGEVTDTHAAATVPQDDGPEKGASEWQVWGGRGYGVRILRPLPIANVWTMGLRYARVLTDAHGPGLLRGRLELGVDVLPLVEVSTARRRVYGAGFDPVVCKWNFVTRRRLSPYWELDGGGLFSNHQMLPGTTAFNFMATTAVGLRFPWRKLEGHNWNTEIRFFHISNAGLSAINPGINTVEFRVGFSVFSHPR